MGKAIICILIAVLACACPAIFAPLYRNGRTL